MSALVLILWAMYVSECFVRSRPGEWIFRQASGGVRGTSESDLSLLGGRLQFNWTALIPWYTPWKSAGTELNWRAGRDAVERCRKEIRWLRVSAAGLFAILLVAIPVLIVTEWLLPNLQILLLALALAWASTFAAFLIAHARTRGRRPQLETWLALALSPVSLIRAPCVVSLSTLSSMHPVAAAAILCDEQEFLRIARLWHFDSPDLRPAIEKIAKQAGYHTSLLAPPSDVEAGAAQFCPRCHATYAAHATRCADCDGIQLAILPVES